MTYNKSKHLISELDQWEEDQKVSREEPTKVRLTKTLCKIKSDFDDDNEMEFYMDTRGEVRIKASAHAEVMDATEKVECDQGHWHPKIVNEAFGFFEARLSRKDVAKLTEFLKRKGW